MWLTGVTGFLAGFHPPCVCALSSLPVAPSLAFLLYCAFCFHFYLCVGVVVSRICIIMAAFLGDLELDQCNSGFSRFELSLSPVALVSFCGYNCALLLFK